MSGVTADSIVKNLNRSLGVGDDDSDFTQAKKTFFGVAVGWVMQPLDPLPLGRLQVRLPAVDSADLIRLARVAVPMAGFEHGTYFIPNVGDEVLVAFEHGDLDAPVIIGSMWNAMAPPPLPSPLAQIRAIRTLTGNQIVLTELPPRIAIQTAPTPPIAMPAPTVPGAPYNSIELSPLGIQICAMSGQGIMLTAGPTSFVLIRPESITLQCGTSSIMLTPQGINIGSNSLINVVSTTACTITAPAVKIN